MIGPNTKLLFFVLTGHYPSNDLPIYLADLVGLALSEPNLRAATRANDLDWFHKVFQCYSPYKKSVDREEGWGYKIARDLGQFGFWGRGDSIVSLDQLEFFLVDSLAVGQAATVYGLCFCAQRELGLTPYRFEQAMIRLWAERPETPFTQETGGGEDGRVGDCVLRIWPVLDQRFVMPGALNFGRDGLVRAIRRLE